MFYTYVLQSKKDKNFYIGFTNDLQKRLKMHNQGLIESTRLRRPLLLIYYEACFNQKDATHREKYLKQLGGKDILEIDCVVI